MSDLYRTTIDGGIALGRATTLENTALLIVRGDQHQYHVRNTARTDIVATYHTGTDHWSVSWMGVVIDDLNPQYPHWVSELRRIVGAMRPSNTGAN